MSFDTDVALMREWLHVNGTEVIREAFERIVELRDEQEFEAVQNIGRELLATMRERDRSRDWIESVLDRPDWRPVELEEARAALADEPR